MSSGEISTIDEGEILEGILKYYSFICMFNRASNTSAGVPGSLLEEIDSHMRNLSGWIEKELKGWKP
jgi:hypothetical protein